MDALQGVPLTNDELQPGPPHSSSRPGIPNLAQVGIGKSTGVQYGDEQSSEAIRPEISLLRGRDCQFLQARIAWRRL